MESEKEEYLITYFGRQSDYYIDKYRLFKSGEKFNFNVAAFLAGVFWFLYRKLWVEGVLILVILILLSIIEQNIYDSLLVDIDTQRIILLASTFVFAGIYGSLGNYIYLKKAENRINAILAKTSVEDERIYLLRKYGGTSWAPFIVFAIFVAFLIVLNGFANELSLTYLTNDIIMQYQFPNFSMFVGHL